MSAITYALSQLKFRIPQKILEITFRDNSFKWRDTPVSLEEQMSIRVIRPRVLLDANIVGGTTIVVNLAGLAPEYVENNAIVIRIPPDRLGNREIMSVITVSMLPISSYIGAMGGIIAQMSVNDLSTVASVGARVGDAMSNMPVVTNSSVELAGANTIVIRNQYTVSNIYQLKCVVGNESNLNNIHQRSWLNFAKLVELAIKSYIYNTMIIRLDEAYLVGGAELGSIKTYIEGLSDAEEMYQTELKEVWGVTAFCNDTLAHEHFIRSHVNPAL